MSAIKHHIEDLVVEAMSIEDAHTDAVFYVDAENVQIAWRAGEATGTCGPYYADIDDYEGASYWLDALECSGFTVAR